MVFFCFEKIFILFLLSVNEITHAIVLMLYSLFDSCLDRFSPVRCKNCAVCNQRLSIAVSNRTVGNKYVLCIIDNFFVVHCKASFFPISPCISFLSKMTNVSTILMFTEATQVYSNLQNISSTLEELKSLQNNLSTKINEINQNFTTICNASAIPSSNCPKLPDVANDFTVVSIN